MEMVERVARAMCPHPSEYGDFLDWVNNDPEGCFLALSKKAIEAMREPTEEMLIDGAAKIRNFTSVNGPYPRTRAVWLSMIDAATGPQANTQEERIDE